MKYEYKKQVTDKYKINSGEKRREMMKVHREQVRQRYHQNVQIKFNKNDVNCQQNKYDEDKKKSSKKGMEMNHEYKKKVTDKDKNNPGKKRREMMKVHREQVRQRYHQNVQSKSNKNDVKCQQNKYDEGKKIPVKKVWK